MKKTNRKTRLNGKGLSELIRQRHFDAIDTQMLFERIWERHFGVPSETFFSRWLALFQEHRKASFLKQQRVSLKKYSFMEVSSLHDGNSRLTSHLSIFPLIILPTSTISTSIVCLYRITRAYMENSRLNKGILCITKYSKKQSLERIIMGSGNTLMTTTIQRKELK